MSYIPRAIESTLRRAAQEFPAILLTGPRQAGKTTLLRRLFGARAGYVSLETPDTRLAVSSDPRGFLDLHPAPVILDEVQRAPELLSFLQERIDRDRDRKGQYLLTGSQDLLLMEGVSQTLAGRVAVLHLLSLSAREIAGRSGEALPWEPGWQPRPETRFTGTGLWDLVVRGGFPELWAEPQREASLWHASYLQTYLERDVRSLRQVGDLTQFQAFLRVLAARTASLLNLSELSRDLGIAVNTARAWLSVLEATRQVTILRPYHGNVGKRLVKTPKVYFNDTGLVCHLVGLRTAQHAAQGPMAGPLLESLVLGEVCKALMRDGIEPQIYFWRTTAGSEVDLLVDTGAGLVPIEIKAASTPRPRMARTVEQLRRDLGDRALPGWVVHPGDVVLPLTAGVRAVPFDSL